MPRFLRKHSDTPLHEMKKHELSDKALHFIERDETANQLNNGYHQVPIVIESQDKCSKPLQCSSKLNIPISREVASFEKEIIDIRAYLSQSRSNMSPFARSSSYRSQYGRQNTIDVSNFVSSAFLGKGIQVPCTWPNLLVSSTVSLAR